MKKRLASIIISVALILSMLPVSAFAAPDDSNSSSDSSIESIVDSVDDSSDVSDVSDVSGDSDISSDDSLPDDSSSDSLPEDPTTDTLTTPVPDQLLEEQAVYEDIPEGYYVLETATDSSYCLEVEGGKDENFANVRIGTKKGKVYQIFKLVKYLDSENRPIYSLEACGTSGKVLDVYAGKSDNFTNVNIYKSNNTAAQRYYITKGKIEDAYVLHCMVGGDEKDMALDVYAGIAKPGANVSIYRANGTKAQEWKFVPASLPEKFNDGTYQIHSLANFSNVITLMDGASTVGADVGVRPNTNNYTQIFKVSELGSTSTYKIQNANFATVLDVYAAIGQSGAKVWSYVFNSSSAQIWTFAKTGERIDGYDIYKIKSDVGDFYLGNVDGKLQILSDDGSDNIKWVFTDAVLPDPTVQEGMYTINCKGNDNKVLDIHGASYDNGAALDVYSRNNSSAQKFIIKKTSDGYFTIQAVCSGKYLNVPYAEGKNGNKIWQYSNDGSRAMKFNFVDTGDGDGSYYIKYYDTEFTFDVPGADFTNFNTIQLYKKNGTLAQKFYFRRTCTSVGWQHYMGGYRYIKDSEGNYYTNCKTPDGFLVDKNGIRKEQWVIKDGFYRYMLADGSLVNDTRPYLSKLFGTKNVTTFFGTFSAPKCSYKATVDRSRCLVTIYTKYPGTNSYNLPVCAFKCSPGKNSTPTDAGNWTTCELAGTWSLLMGPSYGQYATRIHGGELFHSVACSRMNRYNLDPGTYNALGTKQSHGCVRLNVRNAYWIYYYCGVGMPVHVGDYLANPIANAPQPKMYGNACIDPTDPYYTGNYGYADTNVYYGSYYF
ncbi:MAG: RICIN domain-containing protein [Lachnospiraceae bacterium]|jgi:hypothetical protein